jgi:hypothetical protein
VPAVLQEYAGTRLSCDQQEFVDRVQAALSGGQPLAEGYAPFCKHVFIRNHTDAVAGALPITQENCHLLQSGAWWWLAWSRLAALQPPTIPATVVCVSKASQLQRLRVPP